MKIPLPVFLAVFAFTSSAWTPCTRAQTPATLTVLHGFGTLDSNGTTYSDGIMPEGGVLLGNDGNLYGTALSGGPFGNGTIFRCTPAGVFTVLHSFSALDGNRINSDGATSYSGLIEVDGNFYGTTTFGGAGGNGTIFMVKPDGSLTTLHSFTAGGDDRTNDDGANPSAGLLLGADGNFYGTSAGGGKGGDGTIFRFTPDGTLSTLYSFSAIDTSYVNSDGASPSATLIQDHSGNIYGTTYYGGANRHGTIFQLTPDGILNTLHSFDAGLVDSQNLYALAAGDDGNFYGTTFSGGTNGNGSVYQVTPSGQFNVLYNFSAGTGFGQSNNDGNTPSGGLLKGLDGNFYGTAHGGGTTDGGTVFRITPAGTLNTMYEFNLPDAFGPYGNLIQDANGNLYGIIQSLAGANGLGAIYELSSPTLTPPPPPPPVSVPTVTVKLRGDGIAVRGGQSGSAMVYRTGDTSAELAVLYKIKGTAQVDVDYKHVTGAVAFPVGVAQVKIKIKAVANETRDGTHTAKIKLLPVRDNKYLIGDPAMAKVKIMGGD